MEMIRLEYSEEQGCFHFKYKFHEPKIFGWIVICNKISYNQALEFANLILEKYPKISLENKSDNQDDYPPVYVIKQEFVNFLLT